MPGRTVKQTPRQQRDEMVEDIQRHLTEAEGVARMVGGSIDDDGNDGQAWGKAANELAAVLDRIKKLPR